MLKGYVWIDQNCFDYLLNNHGSKTPEHSGERILKCPWPVYPLKYQVVLNPYLLFSGTASASHGAPGSRTAFALSCYPQWTSTS